MFHSLALAIHIIVAAIWIGGMFFAYVCLRPVLGEMEPPQRLETWVKVFGKFFPWVWLCIAVLFFSGFFMLFALGGFGYVGNYVYVMLGLAVVMTAIFKFIYVAPFNHLKRGIEEKNYKVAAFALGTIRKLVAVNLTLGILVIITATVLKGIV